MAIGLMIRDIRKAQGLSQQALAERLDIGQQAVSNVENGITKFDAVFSVAKWAEALGMTPGEFVSLAVGAKSDADKEPDSAPVL